jgi:hypothetical protein
MDSAKHIEQSFWAGFRQAAGVYILGEVYNGDPQYVMPYQQYLDGLLDYPRYGAGTKTSPLWCDDIDIIRVVATIGYSRPLGQQRAALANSPMASIH